MAPNPIISQIYFFVTSHFGTLLASSKLSIASTSQRVLVKNFSHGKDFDSHENESADETNFHLNGFGRRPVLTQKQKATRKWAIGLFDNLEGNIK